jgi:hypothetical protein
VKAGCTRTCQNRTATRPGAPLPPNVASITRLRVVVLALLRSMPRGWGHGHDDAGLLPATMVDRSFGVGCSTDEWRPRVLAVEVLGWVGSALLVYSVLQTRILRLRLFNGVASALLVIFNAAIAVWPMVALNATLTAINAFLMVRLLRGRHDSRTFEVVEISPNEAYLKHILLEFCSPQVGHQTTGRVYGPGGDPGDSPLFTTDGTRRPSQAVLR